MMPTHPRRSLYLFPHQDDEFPLLGHITRDLREQCDPHCVYVTDGAARGVSSQTRDQESLRVLGSLGVSPRLVTFLGSRTGIGDGALAAQSALLLDWLRHDALASDQTWTRIYVPAWEGGHPDHDSLHRLVVQVAAENGHLEKVRQFPLYNAWRVPAPFFRVLRCLPANGPQERLKLDWRSRVRHLRLCLSYPSQWKTWVGLFPFVVLHQLFYGTEMTQGVSVDRTQERPHPGGLLYERRSNLRFESLLAKLSLDR